MAEEPQQERSVSSEEIARLERQLEEKKRALTEQGKEAPQEKEILRQVVREQMEGMKPSAAPAPDLPPQAGEPLISALKPASIPAPPSGAPQDQQKNQVREEELKALIEFAMAHSIQSAVEKAQAESPYLLDALHDRLADEYYEKMVALRKLKQL